MDLSIPAEKLESSNKWRRLTWFILIVTVLYGMHLRNVAYTQTLVDVPIRADAYDYYHYAKNLAEHGVFSRQDKAAGIRPPVSDALRSPGFPAFASLYMAGGPVASVTNTLLAQTLLQVVCFVFLTFQLVRWLGVGWSIPAAVILWTFPHFVSINTYYLSESLFTSGLALFICLYGYYSDDSFVSLTGALVCGLLLGLLALVRPVVEYLPWFIAVALLCQHRRAYRRVAIFLGMSLLPIIAWKMRNLAVIGVMSDPTLMINGLYHGSFPGFMFEGKLESLGFPYRFDPRAGEVSVGLWATLALIGERFLAAPLDYGQWYLFGKQGFLWRWDILAGQGDIFIYPIIKSPYLYLPDMQLTLAANKIIHPYWLTAGFVSTAAILLGSLRSAKSFHPVWFMLVLIIVYAVLMHVIVAPFPRYGIPFKLALIVMAGFGIKEFTRWITRLKKAM